MGIEVTPSPHYWSQVWHAIIRDCYGSYAIQVSRQQPKVELPPTRTTLNLESISSLEDLEAAVQQANQREQQAVEELLQQESQKKLPQVQERKVVQHLETEDIQVRSFGLSKQQTRWQGQLLLHKGKIHYASLYRPVSI